jgi:hypothetical protein
MAYLYASADNLSTDTCSRMLQISQWNEAAAIAEVAGNGDGESSGTSVADDLVQV